MIGRHAAYGRTPHNTSNRRRRPTGTASAPVRQHPAAAQRIAGDPTTALPAEVVQLQRTYGNRAVSHLIQTQREDNRGGSVNVSAGGVPAGRIQRFAYRDNPVDWSGLDRFWKMPGGRRGVYAAEKGNDTIIVKLDDEAPTGGQEFANRLIEEGVGLQAPGARAILPNSPEWNLIMDLVRRWAQEPVNAGTRIEADYQNDIATTNVILLMNQLRGITFLDLLSDQDNHSTLTAALQTPSVLHDIGRMIVMDIFMGNMDRVLPHRQANVGNFMLSLDGDAIITLDSYASKFSKLALQETGELNLRRVAGSMIGLNNMFDRIDKYVNNFITTIETGSEQQTGHKITSDALAGGWDGVREGIEEGAAIAREELYARLKARKAEIKGEYTTLKDDYDDEGVDWTTYKTRLEYVKARNAGEDDAGATQEAKAYAKYKHWKLQHGQHLERATTIDDEVMVVPDRPEDLSKKEKLGRTFKRRSKSERKAAKAKKKARKGKLDQIDESVFTGDDRRAKKARYEFKFSQFIASLEDKIEAVTTLQNMVEQADADRDDEDAVNRKSAVRSLTHAEKHLSEHAQELDGTRDQYADITHIWEQSLPKKPRNTLRTQFRQLPESVEAYKQRVASVEWVLNLDE